MFNKHNNLLEVVVPANMRPGKFLRRNAPADYGQDYSALVSSLDYVLKFAGGDEWDRALTLCTSCQSQPSTRKLYAAVWQHLGIELLIALDKKGQIVARCLVDSKRSLSAPTYGPRHYILNSRLRYAGYTSGELRSRAEVREAVRAIAPECFKLVDNHSRKYENSVTLKRPDWAMWALEELGPMESEGWLNLDRRKRCTERNRIRKDLKRTINRWRRWCRNVGVNEEVEEITRVITSFARAKGEKEIIVQSLYVDYHKEFVKVRVSAPDKKCWA